MNSLTLELTTLPSLETLEANRIEITEESCSVQSALHYEEDHRPRVSFCTDYGDLLGDNTVFSCFQCLKGDGIAHKQSVYNSDNDFKTLRDTISFMPRNGLKPIYDSTDLENLTDLVENDTDDVISFQKLPTTLIGVYIGISLREGYYNWFNFMISYFTPIIFISVAQLIFFIQLAKELLVNFTVTSNVPLLAAALWVYYMTLIQPFKDLCFLLWCYMTAKLSFQVILQVTHQ